MKRSSPWLRHVEDAAVIQRRLKHLSQEINYQNLLDLCGRKTVGEDEQKVAAIVKAVQSLRAAVLDVDDIKRFNLQQYCNLIEQAKKKPRQINLNSAASTSQTS